MFSHRQWTDNANVKSFLLGHWSRPPRETTIWSTWLHWPELLLSSNDPFEIWISPQHSPAQKSLAASTIISIKHKVLPSGLQGPHKICCDKLSLTLSSDSDHSSPQVPLALLLSLKHTGPVCTTEPLHCCSRWPKWYTPPTPKVICPIP